MHTRAGAWLTPRVMVVTSALIVALLATPALAGVDDEGGGTTTTTTSTTSTTTTPPTTVPEAPPPASPPVPPEDLPPPPELPPPAAEPAPVVTPPAADARLSAVTTDAGLQRQRVEGARDRVAALEARVARLKERVRQLRARVRRFSSVIPPLSRELRAAKDDLVATTVAAYRSGGASPVSVLVTADDPVELDRLAKLATAGAAATRTEFERAQRAQERARDRAAAVAAKVPPVEARIDEFAARLPDARARSTAVETQAAVPTAAPVSGLDIPVVTLDAYLRAESTLATEQPGCGITWWALAGVGRIESNHARFGGSFPGPTGDVEPRIIGIPLNGNGVAAISDTDGGEYDGDTVWDRAVGPMQFIPSTWQGYAADGNGDGATNPHNVYDAADGAARYLCRGGGGSLQTDDDLRRAFLAYNHSSEYSERVLDYALAYRDAGLTP